MTPLVYYWIHRSLYTGSVQGWYSTLTGLTVSQGCCQDSTGLPPPPRALASASWRRGQRSNLWGGDRWRCGLLWRLGWRRRSGACKKPVRDRNKPHRPMGINKQRQPQIRRRWFCDRLWHLPGTSSKQFLYIRIRIRIRIVYCHNRIDIHRCITWYDFHIFT